MLTQMADEPVRKITKKLDVESLASLTRVSRSVRTLFLPGFLSKKAQECDRIRDCFSRLLDGDMSPFFRILRHSPYLLLLQLKLADDVGRVFERISLFQYLCWSSNLNGLEALIPAASASPLFRDALIEQWQQLQNKEIHYSFNEVTISESLYSPALLIDHLNQYTNKPELDWTFWPVKIGQIQKSLPMPHLHRYYNINANESTLPVFDQLKHVSWKPWRDNPIGLTCALLFHARNGFAQLSRKADKVYAGTNRAEIEAEWKIMCAEMGVVINTLIATPNLDPVRDRGKIQPELNRARL